MSFVDSFLIPLIEVTFILGILSFAGWFFTKGIRNAWSKQWKFAYKYKILRKSYPDETSKWILDCMDKGIGYYDAKKTLMINIIDEDRINETLWIYDQIIYELNKEKGSDKTKFKGAKNVRQNLPSM